MKKLSLLCAVLLLTHSLQANDNQINILDNWGFDAAFGKQSYKERVIRLGAMTPYLFSWAQDQNHARLTLDLLQSNFVNTTSSIENTWEIDFSFRADQSLFKDILSAYSKLGVGYIMVDSQMYPDGIFNLPLSFGINFVTRNNADQAVGTFYIAFLTLFFNLQDHKRVI